MLETHRQDRPVIRNSRFVSKSPVFYGWIIMMAGALGLILTSPGQTYTVSVFIEYFIEELQISRSVVSTLYTIGTLVGSLVLPIIGRQIDRRGPRQMVAIIAVLFGLACIYMGFVQNALMLGIGFIGIRMFGQGSLGLVSQNVINQWWVHRRGMVTGLSGLLMSLLGLGGFPNLINWLIPRFGWRLTYMLLGLLLLGVMAPLGLLLFRNRPEEYGLQPDGYKIPDIDGDVAVSRNTETNWTLQEAIRTPAFWILGSGIGVMAMLLTGLFFHMISIFEDNGLSTVVATSVFLPIALTTALVNLGSGMLIDRIPVRILLAAGLFCQAFSLLVAQYLTGVGMALVYGVVLGTTSGLIQTVASVAWAMYFGRQHLGSITGVTSTMLIAGSALGPMPFGVAHDLLGSYNLILTLSAILPFFLGAISLFTDKPQKSPY